MTVHKPSKIICPKGQKQIGAANILERGRTITSSKCVSATVGYIPPITIYFGLQMALALERNGTQGSIVQDCFKNGWTNEELFKKWLNNFLNYTKVSVDDPVLIILDNHSNHCSLAIYNFCRRNGIVMLPTRIPPYTSHHHLQPLNLSFFRPLKKAYDMECELFV